MEFVYILICIIVGIFTYIKNRKILKINFLYTLLWCIGGVFVSINYLDMYPISWDTHLLILISICTFNITLFLNKKYNDKFIPEWKLKKSSMRMILLGHALAYAFMIPITFNALRVILLSGWFELREYAYSASAIAGPLQMRIYSWIINPFFSMTMLLASIYLFSNLKKEKKLFLFFGIIDVLLITITFGGRFNILKMFIFALISLFLRNGYMKKIFNIKIRYIVFGILIIILLLYLTSLRSLKGLSIVENIIIYFWGSIVYFDIITHSSIYQHIYLTPMYGTATFGVVTSIPLYLMYMITGTNLTPEFLLDFTSNDFLYIAPQTRYNAFATWIFAFWRDGGVFGVLFGTMMIALAIVFLRKKIKKTKKLMYYSLLIYLLYVVLTSTLTYNMVTIQHTVTLIFLILITRKSYRLQNNEIDEVN